MNKKILIGTCVSLAIAMTLGINSIRVMTSYKKVATNESVKVIFNEQKCTQDELIKSADLIARCKVIDEQRLTKSAITTGADGKEYTVTAPTVTYKMKIVEGLKGSKNDKIDVVVIDSSDNFITQGEEYVVFLSNNKTDGTYALLSYDQGLNKIKQKNKDLKADTDVSVEATQIETAITKETTNYDDLKKRILELGN